MQILKLLSERSAYSTHEANQNLYEAAMQWRQEQDAGTDSERTFHHLIPRRFEHLLDTDAQPGAILFSTDELVEQVFATKKNQKQKRPSVKLELPTPKLKRQRAERIDTAGACTTIKPDCVRSRVVLCSDGARAAHNAQLRVELDMQAAPNKR